MEHNPFIYCFNTPKEKYIYDFNTNAIVKVSPEVYDNLQNKVNSDNMPEIKKLKELGFLKAGHWKKIEHPTTKYIEILLDNNIQAITLQVTQQCNLKCNYCPYSGSYRDRRHNNKYMTLETAVKAIDFYVMHASDMPQFTVGFYGGEPLIEFEMIKKAVEYAKIKCFGKPIEFIITTNATLLDEEKIDYLMQNNFMITISLDGPKQYHDRNRHRIDDSGSFDTVMQNVEKLFLKYPEQRERVQFNCVIDPSNDLQCINDFFINSNMLKDYGVMFNTISREGIRDESQFAPEDNYYEQYNFELFKLLYSKTGKVQNIKVSKMLEAYYLQIKDAFLKRTITCLDEAVSHPGGPCIPGNRKPFVDVHGNIYTCEKVSQCSKDMIIGNVNTGFDVEKVKEILNIGKLTEEECKACWCSKFCFLCVRHADQGNGIEREEKMKHCKSVKNNVIDEFKDYCLLQEINGLDNEVFFLSETGE